MVAISIESGVPTYANFYEGGVRQEKSTNQLQLYLQKLEMSIVVKHFEYFTSLNA